MAKLMVSLKEGSFQVLRREAESRGITIQELLRAVIVPDWIRTSDIQKDQKLGSPIPQTSIRGNDDGVPLIFSGRWTQKRAAEQSRRTG